MPAPLSLEAAIRTQALTFPGLTALLGSTQDTFRWYDTGLAQGSAFPAVVVTLISGPAEYTFEHRLATGWYRVQFDLWGYDPEALYGLQSQLEAFIDQLNIYGVPGLGEYAHQILNRAKITYPDTQPQQYRRIVDARLFFNELTN